MKKIIKLKLKGEALPFFSALVVSTLIFSIFLISQKDNTTKHPIFSKSPSGRNTPSISKISFVKKRPAYVNNQVIVKYKEGEISLSNSGGKDKAIQLSKERSLKKVKSIGKLNADLLEITDGSSVEEKIEELKKDSRVEYAEPNYIRYSSYTPDDTSFDVQWALKNTGQAVNGDTGTLDSDMDVAEMWDAEADHASDIVVAVIDTGVALNHPDISSNLVEGYDVLSDGVEEPYDNFGHGTHVAGIIASVVNNSTGVSGISRMNNVKVMPIRASEGDGSFWTTDVIEGIYYAIDHGADILNLSLGSTYYVQAELDALEDFPGLIVAAAGNGGIDGVSDDNDTTPEYPASYNLSSIISVAATGQNDDLASFSNYGATSVDVGAPGVNIYSLEGYEAFLEDFSSVSAPDLGIQFSSSGVNDNWETASQDDFSAVFSDINGFNSIPYLDSTDSYLTSSSVNIASTQQAYLEYLYYCDMGVSTEDTLAAQVFDGSTWTTVSSHTGVSSGYETIDLTDYADAGFKIRFYWHTDAVSDGTYGCYLDDIKIVDSSSSQGSYQYYDGTSMATPYAAAVAAMVWGNDPSLSVAELKSIILNTGDSVEDLQGVTVSGKRINAYNAYLETTGESQSVVESVENLTTIGNGGSKSPQMSSDGRYIVFDSYATNLVDGDTNGLRDIFLADTQEDTIERLSVNGEGVEGNGDSLNPLISSDGRYIVFYSDATNLVDGDTNVASDIFLVDTQEDTIERVSVSAEGNEGDDDSWYPRVSSDGRYIVFYSDATNLVDGDTNVASDIFLVDTQEDTIERVSVSAEGVEGNLGSGHPFITPNGRYIVFQSVATNLVDGDTNSVSDIFLVDTQEDTIERVSVNNEGVEGNNNSYGSSISSDGRYVVFFSYATNLVDGDTNSVSDIFLVDTQEDTIERVSVNNEGVEGDAFSWKPEISSNGRYVVFESEATNLVDGDTNVASDIFLVDTQEDTIERVSVNGEGVQGNDGSFEPVISSDGTVIAYYSDATNLVDGDTNSVSDIFIASINLSGDEDEDSDVLGAQTYRKDRRCHWKKPESPTWIKLEPAEVDGVSGMNLSWVQYDADKINIKIDDGTGNFPWKIEKTSNDGHEFLPNVSSWQNIMIKPINHCREGEYSLAVSHISYPSGWYGQGTGLASTSSSTLGYSTSSNVLAATSSSSGTNGTNQDTPMVPDTGSSDILFIVVSSLIVSFAVYYTTTGRFRGLALKDFEKKSSKGL